MPWWVYWLIAAPAAVVVAGAGTALALKAHPPRGSAARTSDEGVVGDIPIVSLHRLIEEGRELRAHVRDDETWSRRRAWAEYMAWHARAQAWVERDAPRYAHLYRAAALRSGAIPVPSDLFDFVYEALTDRLYALVEIRNRMRRRRGRAA